MAARWSYRCVLVYGRDCSDVSCSVIFSNWDASPPPPPPPPHTHTHTCTHTHTHTHMHTHTHSLNRRSSCFAKCGKTRRKQRKSCRRLPPQRTRPPTSSPSDITLMNCGERGRIQGPSFCPLRHHCPPSDSPLLLICLSFHLVPPSPAPSSFPSSLPLPVSPPFLTLSSSIFSFLTCFISPLSCPHLPRSSLSFLSPSSSPPSLASS